MYPKEEIDGFEQYWRRRKPGRSTAIHYRSDVNIFFQWAQKSPNAVTVHDIDRFIDWQRELGRAVSTIHRRLIAIRMFYDYLAYIQERDVDNPVIPRRHYPASERRLPRDLPDDVIGQLFKAIGSHLRDRAMFTLMLHAGLRVGELSQLRLADVRLSDEHMPFLRVNGKGGQERVVYLSATAAQLLAEYLKERPPGGPDQIFLNYQGRPISITGIQLRLARYCRQADIWITSHQLRHTYGRPFGRLVNISLDMARYQERVSSPWRLREPRTLGRSASREHERVVRGRPTLKKRTFRIGWKGLAG